MVGPRNSGIGNIASNGAGLARRSGISSGVGEGDGAAAAGTFVMSVPARCGEAAGEEDGEAAGEEDGEAAGDAVVASVPVRPGEAGDNGPVDGNALPRVKTGEFAGVALGVPAGAGAGAPVGTSSVSCAMPVAGVGQGVGTAVTAGPPFPPGVVLTWSANSGAASACSRQAIRQRTAITTHAKRRTTLILP